MTRSQVFTVIASAKAGATDVDGATITSARTLRHLDGAGEDAGLAQHIPPDSPLRDVVTGGSVRLHYIKPRGLRVVSTYSAARELDADELHQLLDHTRTQWHEGWGEGAELKEARERGLVIALDQGEEEVELVGPNGRRVALLGARPPPSANKELAAMLQDIMTAPDDHALRRRYGEALSARKDPRGEFIRLQFEHAAGQLTRKKDVTRMMSLLATHWRAWSGPLCDVMEISESRFDRGFIARLFLTADVRGHPEWDGIFTTDLVGTVTDLVCHLPEPFAASLLGNPYLCNVQRLKAHSHNLMDVTGPWVTCQPTELCVVLDDVLPHNFLRAVAGSSLVSRLHTLTIEPSREAIMPYELRAAFLAHKSIVETVRSLGLSTGGGVDGAGRIFAWLTSAHDHRTLDEMHCLAECRYVFRKSNSGWDDLTIESGISTMWGIGEAKAVIKLFRGHLRSLAVRHMGRPLLEEYAQSLARVAQESGPHQHLRLPSTGEHG